MYSKWLAISDSYLIFYNADFMKLENNGSLEPDVPIVVEEVTVKMINEKKLVRCMWYNGTCVRHEYMRAYAFRGVIIFTFVVPLAVKYVFGLVITQFLCILHMCVYRIT